MAALKSLIENIPQHQEGLPYSIYSSYRKQHIHDVPIVKPLFIAVLQGEKRLGRDSEQICKSGDFIFLSNSPNTEIRNIPKDSFYTALLIEFDPSDFDHLLPPNKKPPVSQHCSGNITPDLELCLKQFLEWTQVTPTSLWTHRRKEIIELLCHMGYENVLSGLIQQTLGQKVHHIISADIGKEHSAASLSKQLAMSESTLRRKLKNEGTSIQHIKDQVKLGHGLHLILSTQQPINLIAEKCGYYSQSRFTERFKERFGTTPTELRKTK